MKIKKILGALIWYTGFSIICAEVFLWAVDYPLWWRPEFYPHQSSFIQADEELGWSLIPGTHTLVLGNVADALTLTINSDGTRISAAAGNQESEVDTDSPKPPLNLLGDSYVMGWGLSDVDSLGWKLQEKLPSNLIRNYGVGGYGTCQSLRLMQKLLKNSKTESTFLYIFNGFHEERNIGSPLSVQVSHDTTQPQPKSCFTSLSDDGKVTTTLEAGKSKTFLTHYFRSAALLDDIWRRIVNHKHFQEMERITAALLVEMNLAARNSSQEFAVVIFTLEEPARSRYLAVLTEHKIPVIDCSSIITEYPSEQLSDGHPNAMRIERLAQCIAQKNSAWHKKN